MDLPEGLMPDTDKKNAEEHPIVSSGFEPTLTATANNSKQSPAKAGVSYP